VAGGKDAAFTGTPGSVPLHIEAAKLKLELQHFSRSPDISGRSGRQFSGALPRRRYAGQP